MRSHVVTKEEEYFTSAEHVFTAGDMQRERPLVIWEIEEGKDAA